MMKSMMQLAMIKPHAFSLQQFEFRDMFYYNNWMYTLMGYLTEVITGTPWEDQVTTPSPLQRSTSSKVKLFQFVRLYVRN